MRHSHTQSDRNRHSLTPRDRNRQSLTQSDPQAKDFRDTLGVHLDVPREPGTHNSARPIPRGILSMIYRLSDGRAAAIFVIAVLSLSLATANIAGGLVLALSPILVTLAMMLLVTREGWNRSGWERLGVLHAGWRYWPAAIGTNALVSIAASTVVVALGYARFITPNSEFISAAVAMAITGPILAFAEEIGWRGYLQARVQQWGISASMLIVGIVWAAWHMPYILLTPYYHSDGNRVLVVALFVGSAIAFSFLFGYLRNASGSVWPAVMAHAAHNWSFVLLTGYLLQTDHPVLVTEYLGGDTGLLVLIGTAVAAWIVFRCYRAKIDIRPQDDVLPWQRVIE